MLTYGTAFSGIEGFGCGFDRVGMRGLFHIEIDPQCRQVLRRHYPDALLMEDVHDCGSHNLPTVDVFAFGSPCQDLSVAGRRQGLDGERSGLFVEGVRIADELAPRWIVFENVPGLFSSQQGEDFAVVLEGFTGFRPAVPEGGWRNGGVCVGPLRWAAWCVYDSQFFGVPQRRRRVFVVAGTGAEPALEVLLECPCVSWHPPPSREAGARVAATLTRGAESQGRGGAAGRRQEDDVNVVAALGSAGGEGRGWRLGADEAAGGQVVAALRASTGGPDDNRAQAGHIVGTLRAHSKAHGHAMTTQQAVESGHVIAVQCHGSNIGPMGTLRQGNGGLTGGVPFIAHTITGREGKGPDFDFTSGAVLAYSATDYKDGAYEEVEQAGPLTTSADRTRSAPITFTERGCPGGRSLETREDGIANALITPGGGRSGTGGGTAVLHSPPGFSGRIGVREAEHADAEEAYAAAIMRVLREEVGEEAFAVWEAGGALPLHPEEVLRSAVHGAGFQPPPVAGEDELGGLPPGGSRSLPSGAVREMRQEEGGGPPPGRGLDEQLARQLAEALPRLPHQGASAEGSVLHRWLLGTAQGAWVLRQALSEVQEVGRSAGFQAEPAHAGYQEGGVGVTAIPRRLTPRLRECSRLQGFPDDWNAWGLTEDGERVELSDSARYRQLGNAVTATVAAWIGERIARAAEEGA